MSRTWHTLDASQREALQRRKIELRGLVLATIMIVLGLLWVYWAQTGAISHTPEDNGVVNLSQVNDPSDLAPALDALENPEREKHLAKGLAEYLQGGMNGEQPVLASVEDVKDVTTQDGSRLLNSGEYQTLRSSFVVRSTTAYGWTVFHYGLLFLLSFFGVHVFWRIRVGRVFGGEGRIFGGTPALLPLVVLLTGIGMVLMISLRDPLREPLIFTDFVVGVALGCVALVATPKTLRTLLPLRRLKSLWYIPFLLGVLLFILLLLFGTGPGNVKINLYFFQPAELIKILVVIFVAGFLARFAEHFRVLHENRSWFLQSLGIPPLELFGTVVVAGLITLTFFYGVREFGSALILALTFFSLFAVARQRWHLATFGMILVVCGFIVGYVRKIGTVSNRVEIWLNPWNNYATYGGDHLAHMLWAFAHGGLTGAGLGAEGSSFIPLAYTDGVLAAIGEQFGALGMFLVVGLYVALFLQGFSIARRANTSFKLFLASGLTLLLAVEFIIIAGGVSGVIPLTGVVTPFLSFGKTSMISNLFIVGVLAHLSDAESWSQNRYGTPLRWVKRISLGAVVLILVRILFVQFANTGDRLARGALVLHGQRGVQDAVLERRYSFNPRLTSLAGKLGRGPIYDRNGIPLATSRWDSVRAYRDVYQGFGVNLDQTVHRSDSRYYPFGEFTYHLLGDIRYRHRWFADNTAFVERERRTHLLGYDDDYRLKKVEDARRDTVVKVPHRDYRPLVPLLRSDWRRNMFLEKDRSIRLTVDIQLQQRITQILERHLQRLGRSRAAVVLLNAETGGLLASVTHPWRGALEDTTGQGASLDRARFGWYPPGSVFKMVTATAALRIDRSLYRQRYPFSADRCRGFGTEELNMEQAVVCSSNDYFSSLAEEKIGPAQLLETAAEYDIQVAQPNNPESLQHIIGQTAFGQGQVTATPLEMARIAGSIARGGQVPSVNWVENADQESKRILSENKARRLGTYMRQVVTHPSGTAHNIAPHQTGLAGKTGTAQKEGQRPFAWFIGYAPSDMESQQVAVAVLIEEGGSGAAVAAPVAADVVLAAQDLGY